MFVKMAKQQRVTFENGKVCGSLKPTIQLHVLGYSTKMHLDE